jgi:hypothetical protein
MKLTFFGFFILLLLSGPFSFAQEITPEKTDTLNTNEEISTGQIIVYQDNRVDSIIKRHIEYNKYQNGIEGYRVQIFFDAGNNSLNRASNVVEQFQLLFPGDTAYISFSEPYYKVRVGDFRTKLDAEGYLQQVLPDYPNAFVIRDKINFPRLD